MKPKATLELGRLLYPVEKVRKPTTKRMKERVKHEMICPLYFFCVFEVADYGIDFIWTPVEDFPPGLQDLFVPPTKEWRGDIVYYPYHDLEVIPDFQNMFELSLDDLFLPHYPSDVVDRFSMYLQLGWCVGTHIYALIHGWWETINSMEGTEYDAGTNIYWMATVDPPNWKEQVEWMCQVIIDETQAKNSNGKSSD
jgi:hypothetical protein